MSRSEKVTKFLSHLFPTERDRLYFELVRDTCNWDPEAKITPNRIQLELCNHDFINRYKNLREEHERIDSRDFGVIGFCGFYKDERPVSVAFDYNYIAIYDIHNTDHDINTQKEFINKMCDDEACEYIFIVKESLIDGDEYKKKRIV